MAIVIVAGITGAVLVARTGMTMVLALVSGVVVGQIFAIGRLVHGLFRNPLNRSYLERFLDEKYHYTATPGSEEEEPVSAPLPAFGGHLVLTDPDADPSPIYDVFVHEDAQIVASVSRSSGAMELLTELTDGRILHSQHLLGPPHRWLVVNRVGSSDPQRILAAHLDVLGQLQALGVDPVPTSAVSVADALSAEHDAYVELGPFLGPFLSVGSVGRNPVPLLVRPSATALLRLGLHRGEGRVPAKVPVSEVPVSEVPVSEVPVSEVPVSEVPVSEVPVSEVPVSEVPVSEVPVSEVPVSEVPAAEPQDPRSDQLFFASEIGIVEVTVPEITLIDAEVPRLSAVSEPIQAVEPAVIEPVTVEPVAIDPVVEPVVVEPVAIEPVLVQPVGAELPVVDTVVSEPVSVPRLVPNGFHAKPVVELRRDDGGGESPLRHLETLVPSHVPDYMSRGLPKP